jgi:uncharacterized membrane protein
VAVLVVALVAVPVAALVAALVAVLVTLVTLALALVVVLLPRRLRKRRVDRLCACSHVGSRAPAPSPAQLLQPQTPMQPQRSARLPPRPRRRQGASWRQQAVCLTRKL